MLPMIAKNLHIEASNKEGWLSGLASVVLERQGENGIELAVAFPAPANLPEETGELVCDGVRVCKGTASDMGGSLSWYAFAEDVGNPHLYEERLEGRLRCITEDFRPDVVHCFGTEYPHTLAMCRVFPEKSRLLVGIQGLCKVYANTYFASLPESVTRSVTLRDWLKKDSLKQQKHKFELRGAMEQEAIMLAGNVTGRTAWDRHYTAEWNPRARYFEMNETLRPDFYTEQWSQKACERHSIFLSQGDYPIKGLHYMLLALPAIREAFPDVKVYVAGNSIIGDGGLMRRLKISAYGRYLRRLIAKYNLEGHICFLGRLDAERMKQQYLRSNLFVCCSTIENSPNSLGEAMLLGVPCVSADVGGISSIFTNEQDGLLYDGFKSPENSYDNMQTNTQNNSCNLTCENQQLETITQNLADAVIEIFSNPQQMEKFSRHAREHAKRTHDKESNYRKLMEIYAEIAARKQEPESVGEQTEKLPQFVFVSNYINHHQIPFCNAMYSQLKGAFVFVQTEPMEEERVRMGWQADVELPYVRYAYEEPENCQRLIAKSPMVLFGGVDDERYIQDRLHSGKPVIRYSERLYKEGQWKAVSPRGLVKKYHDHTAYRDKPVYLLCAGAYVPSDFHLVGAYPHKMLKWGYFPETRHYDVDKLMQGKKPASILWAARFLDWKHPETALACAKYLKDKGYSFHLDIVGDGEQRPMVERLLAQYGLSDCVTLLGYRRPEEVRSLMEQTDIYLTTSDRKEGWGAVINEAMNSGCAVVASHRMGAAPYLIRQGENGYIYEDGNRKMLFGMVEELLQDRALCQRLGREAIAAIEEEWNGEHAAESLLAFCRGKVLQPSGPCSPAEVISERKMFEKILRKSV
jgi:glycosyltransferase involved in cell wall biosynthesis